ncbi:hypothetical protein JB92DRAFT_2835901 [Gautieria morchelliformis]|nr:hypothetical protein JB92DRAFT_2835901 [Gautieria morchelliformis]
MFWFEIINVWTNTSANCERLRVIDDIMVMITTQYYASQNIKIIRKLRGVLRREERRNGVRKERNVEEMQTSGSTSSSSVDQYTSGSGFVSGWSGSAGAGSGSSRKGDRDVRTAWGSIYAAVGCVVVVVMGLLAFL